MVEGATAAAAAAAAANSQDDVAETSAAAASTFRSTVEGGSIDVVNVPMHCLAAGAILARAGQWSALDALAYCCRVDEASSSLRQEEESQSSAFIILATLLAL